eukprot:scaffold965_cov158-Amphora_coffeaeformis.AAC.16
MDGGANPFPPPSGFVTKERRPPHSPEVWYGIVWYGPGTGSEEREYSCHFRDKMLPTATTDSTIPSS